MICDSLPHLAGLLAQSPRAAESQALVNAWVLFGTIAVLLGLFVIFVAVVAVIRRQRRLSPPRRKAEPPTVDPWTEAGRRVRPYPGGDRRR
jgi:hypothetical protein